MAESSSPAGEEKSEATLELTVLSIDLINTNRHKSLSSSSSSSSSAPFAIAWIDLNPSLKISTKTLNTRTHRLHFPLPSSTLQNPTSVLIIQVLSSRLPFLRPKLVGAAALPLSSLHSGGGNIQTLQLCKPSGQARGSVRVIVRIFWCLGFQLLKPPDPPCTVEPSAPPFPELGVMDESEGSGDCSYIGSRKLGLVDECGGGSEESEEGSCDCAPAVEEIGETMREDKGDEKRAWRSFLVGLASGTVAAVLVGAAC